MSNTVSVALVEDLIKRWDGEPKIESVSAFLAQRILTPPADPEPARAELPSPQPSSTAQSTAAALAIDADE